MINTVLYNVDDSKALKSKGFSDIEKAKAWMDEQTSRDNIQNARIVVGYEAVEVYQELYELMKEKVFGTKQNIQRTEI